MGCPGTGFLWLCPALRGALCPHPLGAALSARRAAGAGGEGQAAAGLAGNFCERHAGPQKGVITAIQLR